MEITGIRFRHHRVPSSRFLRVSVSLAINHPGTSLTVGVDVTGGELRQARATVHTPASDRGW